MNNNFNTNLNMTFKFYRSICQSLNKKCVFFIDKFSNRKEKTATKVKKMHIYPYCSLSIISIVVLVICRQQLTHNRRSKHEKRGEGGGRFVCSQYRPTRHKLMSCVDGVVVTAI